MSSKTIEAISDQEWEQALAAHLDWGRGWHGDLPADVFFGVWASLAREAKPLIVKVQLGASRLTVTVPPGSPLAVSDNRILLEDGRELLLEFAS
jgi:hypothetical protein